MVCIDSETIHSGALVAGVYIIGLIALLLIVGSGK
jgi:hypothetical protein